MTKLDSNSKIAIMVYGIGSINEWGSHSGSNKSDNGIYFFTIVTCCFEINTCFGVRVEFEARLGI